MPADPLDSQYGSAQLFRSGQDDLSPFWTPGGAAGLPLGINKQGDNSGLAWYPGGLKGHHCVFGQTGSGKGVSSIIPGLMTYNGSAVVIDPMGQNAWATAERRRQMGQRIVLLDPWGKVDQLYGSKVGHHEKVTRFNPLSAIDPSSDDLTDAVTAIADAIVTDESTDPHWSNTAKELQAGTTAMAIERGGGKASLGDVRDITTLPPIELQKLITLHCERFPNSIGASKLRGFSNPGLLRASSSTDTDGKRKKTPPPRLSGEFNSVCSVARTQTAFIDEKHLRASLETDAPPFDLASLGTEKVTLYLVLPVDKLTTYGRWLRLIITLAIRAISRLDTPPKPPVWFCLDEFGTIGRLEAIETAYGLLRGSGVAISAYLQGLDQLQTFYPKSWETFINNSAAIQILSAHNKVTSEYFADYLGTQTLQVNRGGYRSEMFSPANPRRDADGNAYLETRNVPDIQPMQRPVMFPEELRRIPETQQLVIYPGHFNSMVERLVYFKEPRWRGLYRTNPLHAAPPALPALPAGISPQAVPANGNRGWRDKVMGGKS